MRKVDLIHFRGPRNLLAEDAPGAAHPRAGTKRGVDQFHTGDGLDPFGFALRVEHHGGNVGG
jgi:hypothetical protein